ncbi:MAG: putative lipopolysaccharide heptosyltransferase III [Chlamydiae bacterium]|nr:putative lipopolysaccharide heptosyltransferase III [Chlamydiota bacterium]
MTYGNYPDHAKIKKILVVKLRHHGDVLLTSPVFSCLKQGLPEACIDVLLYKDTLPMLEGHPSITNFLLYDRSWKKLSLFSRIKKELSLLWHIRKNKYDLVINLTEGDRGAIAALISGSLYKVGFDRRGKRVLGQKNIYSQTIKHCPNPRHTVEKQLDALRCIGLFPSMENRDLFLHVPQQARLNAQDMVAEGPYVVIHPVSRWRFKCLPAQTIARVIKELVAQGKKVVLTSGPDTEEKKMIEELLSYGPKHGVIDLSGKTTLKELAALIANSQLLLCVDSVPLHIASALKTPVVAMFGPSSELNWGPWMHPLSLVLTEKMPCRPCFKDGCAGSKMSDCLFSMQVGSILSAIKELENKAL